MRSMAIYELGSDYVNYSRSLGIGDRKMTRYIFRNAMLPQITGLALSIGTMVGGALITELVFSYPGMGVAAVRRDLLQRLPGDPGGHADHHRRRAGRQLPGRDPLRLHRSADPCIQVRGEVI